MPNLRDTIENLSTRAMVVIFAILVLVVGLIMFFLSRQGGGEEPAPEETPSISAPSAPAPSATPTSTGEPQDIPTQGQQEGTPENVRETVTPDRPAYIEGVPYSSTERAIKEWGDRRATFMRALVSESGSQADQAKEVSTDDVIGDLSTLEPGQYSDIELVPNEGGYQSQIDAEPYSYQETFATQDGGSLSVTVEYIWGDDGKGEWYVTSYNVSE